MLAGCVPQAERNLKSLNGLGDGVSLVGVAQLERVVEVDIDIQNPFITHMHTFILPIFGQQKKKEKPKRLSSMCK